MGNVVWTTAGALLGSINAGRYVGVDVVGMYIAEWGSYVSLLFRLVIQRLLVYANPDISDRYTHTFAVHQHPDSTINMALLRTLTTKIKTKMSPATTPTTSPTSPQVSSFERVSGHKDYSVPRPETQVRMDSFIDDEDVYEAPKETEKKEKRVSRFREEFFE